MRGPPKLQASSPREFKCKQNDTFPGPQAFVPLKPVSEDYGLLVETKLKRKVECFRLLLEKKN